MAETLAKPFLGQSTHPRNAQHDAAPPQAADFDLARMAIFLDIDGTLLDIAASPLDVRVPDALRTALQALQAQTGGAVAFVSGRPVAEIDRLFAPLKLPAVGGHGAEIRFTPSSAVRRSALATLNAQLRTDFARIVQIDPGILIEDKGFSLAIHYRQAPQCSGTIMKAVAALCREERCATLEILPGKLVIEIKPTGYDKGTGLQEMMQHGPFHGRRPLFIGDDVTDDAAFAVLAPFGGLGFSVGGVVAGARYNFDGPEDVRHWLYDLSRQAGAEEPPWRV